MMRLLSYSLLLAACSLRLGLSVTVTRSFLAVDADAVAQAHLPSFDDFVTAYGRSFEVGSADHTLRKGIYERRLEEIRRHNAVPGRTWTAGVNHLSDLTDDEFQSRLGWRHSPHVKAPSASGSSLLELERAMPFQHDGEVSYMNLSMAEEVPDQGGCGSCWAVASSQLLQARYEIAFPDAEKRSFSAQELVSCVPNPKNCGGKGGCDGATVELAMDYYMHNGVGTDKDTPYAGENGKCKQSNYVANADPLDKDGRQVTFVDQRGSASASSHPTLSHFKTLETNKFDPLIKELYQHGPVGVTVAASDWSLYSKGVFDGCTDPTLNHAVLLMGITKNPQAYNIKNSWGKQWGEGGYIRLVRTDNEEQNCATDTKPKEGVTCDGPASPVSVHVCGTCGILYDNVVPYFAK